LLASPLPVLALVLAAAFAAIARRPRLAAACALVVLAGACWAQERIAALDRTRLAPLMGEAVELPVAVLEPPRRARFGGRSALASVVAGTGSGERMVLRAGRDVAWPRLRPGEIVHVAGRLVPLGPHESHHRRRGVHGAVIVSAVEPSGRRRGGWRGAMDRLQERTETTVTAGLDQPRGALALGMVLGRDERLSERVRADFRDSGLAHLLAASGQNVMLLAVLAVAVLGFLGAGLRARLLGAVALIAIYVPLAGAGPSIQRAAVMGAAAITATLAGRPASRW
jgi:competence protein ComEC